MSPKHRYIIISVSLFVLLFLSIFVFGAEDNTQSGDIGGYDPAIYDLALRTENLNIDFCLAYLAGSDLNWALPRAEELNNDAAEQNLALYVKIADDLATQCVRPGDYVFTLGLPGQLLDEQLPEVQLLTGILVSPTFVINSDTPQTDFALIKMPDNSFAGLLIDPIILYMENGSKLICKSLEDGMICQELEVGG